MLIFRLLIIGLAAAAGLAVGIAGSYAAGDCTTAKVSYGDGMHAEIRTIVKNNTSNKAFDVTVYRNDTAKNNKNIDNTDRTMRTTMNIGDHRDVDEITVKIVFETDDSNNNLNCIYTVAYLENGAIKWALPNGLESICPAGIKSICDDCGMTCENKFIGGGNSNRWTTTLAICDFLDKDCNIEGN